MSLITLRFQTLFNANNISRILVEPTSSIQIRNYAARKGTRERKAKKKVKPVVVEKVGFIPHNLRKKEKLLAQRPTLKFSDVWKRDPIDNVYVFKYYKWKNYSFQEAVQCHKETHHPTIYNMPTAPLHTTIELNMLGEKKTRFVDDFTRIVSVPHRFDHGEERSIIAFSKSSPNQKEALDAGAQLAGGSDLIKQVQNGAIDLNNFNYVIAHPDILPELVSLRGLMKRKFPNPRAGTLDVDLTSMTLRFLHGIHYTAKKDEHEKDFGIVQTVVGNLGMTDKELEENFIALIQDLDSMKPKRAGEFITRCLLWSPPSSEKFKIDHGVYLKQDLGETAAANDDDNEEIGETVTL